MINRNNIVDYINFLYKKKFNQAAPADLLESWTGLSDNEAVIHLNGLYRHWNLDTNTAHNYEQEFFAMGSNQTVHNPIMPPPPPPQTPASNPAQQTAQQIPPQQQQFQYPLTTPKKSSNGWIFILIGLVVLGAVGYYLWDLKNTSTGVPEDVAATNTANQQANQVPEPQPTTIPDAPAIQETNEEDNSNIEVIKNLLYAEGRRNFDEIYANFSPNNLERYWDINYPTYDELQARYQDTWGKTENNEHTNIKVEKVGKNTYNVSSTYSYFSLKDQKQKRVSSKVRFVFNDENQIIKTYGL